MQSGKHTLHCVNPSTGAAFDIPVSLQEGETRVVWLADTGGIAVAATASLNGVGAKPTFHKFNFPIIPVEEGINLNAKNNSQKANF